MKKSVAMKWAKALRSGKYKQATDQLEDHGAYCCLGVLCLIAEKEGVPVIRTNGALSGFSIDVQEKVSRWAGIRDNGYLYKSKCVNSSFLDSLAGANDSHHLNFDEIADIVENEWRNIT